jgi:hypothetical protein
MVENADETKNNCDLLAKQLIMNHKQPHYSA